MTVPFPLTGWLVSSAGRRGELVKILQNTSVDGHTLPVTAIDITAYSAAGQMADNFELVPRCTDPAFIARVSEVATQHHANLIIPTIDPEIAIYASARDELKTRGIHVWVSTPEIAQLGWDKWKLAQFCDQHQLPSPTTVEIRNEDAAREILTGPVIVKPRSGSASIGVHRFESVNEVDFRKFTDDFIIQSCVPGVEVTIDFGIGKNGQLLGFCPRKRLEVRAGEVSKAVTIDHPAIDSLMTQISTLLKGAYGMLNLQVFLDEHSGEITILELNPRFGGGFPLAHAAGTRLIDALIADYYETGNAPSSPPRRGQSGLVMLRYDAHVIAAAQDLAKL